MAIGDAVGVCMCVHHSMVSLSKRMHHAAALLSGGKTFASDQPLVVKRNVEANSGQTKISFHKMFEII